MTFGPNFEKAKNRGNVDNVNHVNSDFPKK